MNLSRRAYRAQMLEETNARQGDSPIYDLLVAERDSPVYARMIKERNKETQMDKHEHISVSSNFYCEECGFFEERCAVCGIISHECGFAAPASEAQDENLRRGYRRIPEFPEYMVNKQANIRHIATGHSCWLDRITKDNHAMVTVRKNGERFARSAQDLRDSAFA